MKEKISVILPVYNAEKFLEEAIKSILDQTYKNFELIIYDDGSKDNSKNIIDSFNDSRIKYFKNDKNLGLIKTLNNALKFSTGEYIARMDADDICLPDRFQKQISFFNFNDVDILGTEICFINENSKILGRGVGKYCGMKITPYTFLQRSPLYHSTVMFKRKVLDREDFYDADFIHAEDYELWLRLSKKHKIDLIDEPLLFYRIHGDSITSNNSEIAIKSVGNALERHLGHLHKGILPKVRFEKLRVPGDQKRILNFWLSIKNDVDSVFLAQNIIILFFPKVLPKLFGVPLRDYIMASFFFLRGIARKRLGLIKI